MTTILSIIDKWTIKINELPSYDKFKKPFTVSFDKQICQLLMSGINPKITKCMISNFTTNVLRNIDNNNKLIVTHNNPHGLGRFYSQKDSSPCCHSKFIKHTVFSYQNWLDIDMIKGHSSILYHIGTKNGETLPAFKDVVYNWDTKWREISIYYFKKCGVQLDEDNIKYYFNMTIYGGGYEKWISMLADEEDALKYGYLVKKIPGNIAIHPLMKLFKTECRKLANLVFLKNPDIVNRVAQDKNEEYEKICSTMSYFCGIIENHIIYFVYNFLVKKGGILPNQCLPELDGICMPRIDGVDYDALVEELNCLLSPIEIRFKIKGYDKFVLHDIICQRKEIDEEEEEEKEEEEEDQEKFKPEDLQPEGRNDRFVSDDNAAANILFWELQNRLIPSKGRLFFKKNYIWISETQVVNDNILNFILTSEIYKANEKCYSMPNDQNVKTTKIPYVQNVNTAKNVREALYVKIKTQTDIVDIYEKFHSTTKNRLCFQDGVLDFKTKKFYKWDEIDFEYYTTEQIDYPFADYFNNPNMDTVKEIKEKIYENMFGNKTTKALNFLSRAIAGNCEDKNWATYLGNRDCGKGVLYDNLKNALSSYVKTFELGNIMYERHTDTQEVSRKLYWLLDFEFSRLAISQETPPPSSGLKMNGKMMKKLAGGGDEHVARRNFDRVDTHFKIDSTFMFFGNNELLVDCKDTMEHCIQFSSVNQFKTKEEIEKMKSDGASELLWSSYKIKDPKIKSQCSTEEWKKATIYLLFENYIESALTIESESIDPEENEITLRQKILENYDITGNENDFILVSDVIERLNDCKKKINNELVSMGVIKKKSKNKINRDKLCYFGISIKKEKNENNEKDEEEDASD